MSVSEIEVLFGFLVWCVSQNLNLILAAGVFGNGSPAQPQPSAFGMNPQSNPFLSQAAPNQGMNGGFGQMGGMTSFGNGAAINQANSNVSLSVF